jgi:hypothetical protein
MKKLSLFILFTAAMSATSAQNIIKSIEKSVPGQGNVTIHQDSIIGALLGNKASEDNYNAGERTTIKSTGYRVQVYAGSNSRAARSEASAVGSRVKTYFPDTSVYTFFSSPRWLCRVGDFRSIEEADAMMRKLKATGVFKQVAIVKDQINIHL